MTVPKRTLKRATAVLLAAQIVSASALLCVQSLTKPKTIVAQFVSAVGIYEGDEVRVAGVKVGNIVSVRPDGSHAELRFTLKRDVPVPADAHAVIVAQNLVSARYVQLTAPSSSNAGVISDGVVIPMERTAVPVEWDQVKEQLDRLATDLGPRPGQDSTSLATFIDSSAAALAGNGPQLRETMRQLAALATLLGKNSGNIVDTIKNLQAFVTMLRSSGAQVVQFQDRLATLTNVLDSSRTNLDAALTNLAEAVVTVQDFVAQTRDKTSEQVQHLSAVTQTLVDRRMDLEQLLHVAPNAIANTYNMFDPQMGTPTGVFTLANLANPVQFLCGAVGAVENVTAPEAAKLCAQYFGPALNTVSLNALPFPVNPFLAKNPGPEKLIYTDPSLMPGTPPPPPSGGLPDVPIPGGVSTDAPQSLPDMMLPQDGSNPSDTAGPATPPLPAEIGGGS